MSKPGLGMVMLSAALSAATLGLGALCFQLAFDTMDVGRSLAADGVETAATIEALSPKTNVMSRFPTQEAIPEYDLTYLYFDGSGRAWGTTRRMSFPYLPAPKVGGTIYVRYLPSRPEVHELSRGTVASSAMSVLLIAVLSTAFGIAVLAHLLWQLVLHRRLERLFQE
ncbi:hypothetical protein [Paradevosia shaoguanensis]|uniref:hypothetical protein n=1 Tax=Paradevosia shaoguanensis TaxID=1335043 RepID=UPI003C7466F3